MTSIYSFLSATIRFRYISLFVIPTLLWVLNGSPGSLGKLRLPQILYSIKIFAVWKSEYRTNMK